MPLSFGRLRDRCALSTSLGVRPGDACWRSRAVVIGETFNLAQDAADQVTVEYQPIAPVPDISGSSRQGASQLWPQAPDNVALDYAAPADPDRRNKAEIDRCLNLTPQYDQLTSECRILCLKPALRLEWRGQDGQDEAEQ
jgi:hypothetical protein